MNAVEKYHERNIEELLNVIVKFIVCERKKDMMRNFLQFLRFALNYKGFLQGHFNSSCHQPREETSTELETGGNYVIPSFTVYVDFQYFFLQFCVS